MENEFSRETFDTEPERTASLRSEEDKISHLNKILRGELSAVEAYQRVIEKFRGEAEAMRLTDIRNEHAQSSEKLRLLVQNSDDVPSQDSGAWGSIVASIVGAASLAGNKGSIKALIEGEEHGLKLYKEAFDYNLTEQESAAITNELMPRLERHLAALKAMLSAL